MCDCFNANFRQIIIITDGHDNTIETLDQFRALTLHKKTVGEIAAVRGRNDLIEFDARHRVESLHHVMQLLMAQNQVLLLSIVCLNNPKIASEMDGIVVTHLDGRDGVDETKVREVANRVRLETVPRENGGGRGSKPIVALLGDRLRAMADDRSRLCMFPTASHSVTVRKFQGGRWTDLKKGGVPAGSNWLLNRMLSAEVMNTVCSIVSVHKAPCGCCC
jgi:hypothetical protein